METARVKFFNAAKKYGFLKLDDGEELFFHFNDGEFIIAGEKKPKFSGRAKLVIRRKPRGLKDPGRDDFIVFYRSTGSKGPIASPWGFQSHYARAEAVIKARVRVKYRVLLSYLTPNTSEYDKPRVKWEGYDLQDKELKRVWHPVHERSTFSCGDFDSKKWFERWDESAKKWVECSDPRTR